MGLPMRNDAGVKYFCSEGSSDGLFVGSTVGVRDGDTVGDGLGFAVGGREGDGVG